MAAPVQALAEGRAGSAIGETGASTHLLHRSQPAEAVAGLVATGPAPAGSLHALTCGSVDDGKSTLIGRMLWDAGALTTDQRAAIERSPRTPAGTPDFSRLLDGLAAEREQGITIDIAWRYFDAPADTRGAGRRLVIIDSPGHEQYTRNMATGASHADAAILLVDARSGVKVQTRRHAAILDLMGVSSVVLAVNKMDLVHWSEARFRAIEAEFLTLARRFAFRDAAAIPVSAVLGDNVARRSEHMPWYGGVPLLEHLRQVPGRRDVARGAADGSGGSFRFPVQMVVRAGQDFRGLAGTVVSGEIAPGDEVVDAASRRRARVRRIVTMGRDLDRAGAGRAVVLQLDTDIDVSRGAVLAAAGEVPAPVRGLEARLVWLADAPYDAGCGYLLRTATDIVPVTALEVDSRLDLATLEERPAAGCKANDIAATRLQLGRAAVVEPFAESRETGSFVLIDAVTGATVAGGVAKRILDETPSPAAGRTFRLTRALLRQGVGADLGHDAAAEAELRRRANEVAILLRGAGVAVELDDGWTGTDGRRTSHIWLGALAALSFAYAVAVVLGLIAMGQ
jgi:bifunctional enzyme CysN/CysC